MYFVSFQIYYLLSLTSIRDRHQLTTSKTGLQLISHHRPIYRRVIPDGRCH